MNGTKRPRARAARLLGGLAALALALLAPRAAASVPRAGEMPVPVDSFSATAIESPIGVAPLSEGLDLTALERALIPDADVTEAPLFSLGDVVLAETEHEQRFGLGPLQLVDVEALRGSPESYPETRIRAFAFLGSTLIGVSRGVSLELLPGYERIGLGLAEGDVVNLYAYVGLQPHAATDPTGRCMGLDDIDCSAYLKEVGSQLSSPGEIWASAKRSGGFAWNMVGGFVRAPFEAVRGVAELTGSLIGDPRGTTEGLLAAGKQLLEDPSGTLKAVGTGVLNADPAAAADQAGQILFDIATAGAARAMRAPRMATGLEDLARASKIPKASTGRKVTDALEGSRYVRRAEDIGRGARRIDAVEDAGHAARSLERGAQGARHLDDGLGCHLRLRGIGAAMASFAPETPVATEDGLKPIQSISPGDEVWALNEKTGERTLRKVLSTVLHLDDDAVELTAGGENLLTTADHPFFTASGEWVEAAKLKVGQEVQSLGGELLRVEKVEKRDGRFAVFNFEVDEDHSYFVGTSGLGVHNCPILHKGYDSQGRLISVRATISSADLGTGTRATAAARRAAQSSLGQAGDQAGHLVARILGGKGGVRAGNIAGMSPRMNQGRLSAFEKAIAKQVSHFGSADLQIDLIYTGPSRRFSFLKYSVNVNGQPWRQGHFPN